MKTIQKKHGAVIACCALFFAVLLLPCTAQEAAGTLSQDTAEYQTADAVTDVTDEDEFTVDSEDSSAKPVFTLSGKLE